MKNIYDVEIMKKNLYNKIIKTRIGNLQKIRYEDLNYFYRQVDELYNLGIYSIGDLLNPDNLSKISEFDQGYIDRMLKENFSPILKFGMTKDELKKVIDSMSLAEILCYENCRIPVQQLYLPQFENILLRNNIFSTFELLTKSESTLLGIKGLGNRFIEELKKRLSQKFGFNELGLSYEELYTKMTGEKINFEDTQTRQNIAIPENDIDEELYIKKYISILHNLEDSLEPGNLDITILGNITSISKKLTEISNGYMMAIMRGADTVKANSYQNDNEIENKKGIKK